MGVELVVLVLWVMGRYGSGGSEGGVSDFDGGTGDGGCVGVEVL